MNNLPQNQEATILELRQFIYATETKVTMLDQEFNYIEALDYLLEMDEEKKVSFSYENEMLYIWGLPELGLYSKFKLELNKVLPLEAIDIQFLSSIVLDNNAGDNQKLLLTPNWILKDRTGYLDDEEIYGHILTTATVEDVSDPKSEQWVISPNEALQNLIQEQLDFQSYLDDEF